MQEQKAENTGRQFCSCFYQLLGIGGSGSTMPGRILGGSCGNVRLFSVPPPPLPLFLLFILVRSRIPPLLSHLSSTLRSGLPSLGFPFSSARRLRSGDLFLSRSSCPPSSSVLPSCLGYQGSSRSPSTVHSATWCALYLRTVRAPWRGEGGRSSSLSFPPPRCFQTPSSLLLSSASYSSLLLSFFSTPCSGCSSISADRLKIGSQQSFRCSRSRVFDVEIERLLRLEEQDYRIRAFANEFLFAEEFLVGLFVWMNNWISSKEKFSEGGLLERNGCRGANEIGMFNGGPLMSRLAFSPVSLHQLYI